MISSCPSILGIMAQRLVRILCKNCKSPVAADDLIVRKYNLRFDPEAQPLLYQPVGYPKCAQTGYPDRTAIFELMVMSDQIRELILQHESAASIR